MNENWRADVLYETKGSRMKMVAIIPARIGSKRLKEKNIREVFGKPLLGWVINAANRFVGHSNVYVSTESDKVAEVAKKYWANVIERPEHLAGDDVLTEPVVQHALGEIEKEQGEVDIVIWLNASIPEVEPRDIKAAYIKLMDYNLWEVCTVDRHGICTSAVRVLTRKALRHKGLSVYLGTIERDFLDVHYEEDLRLVEEKLRKRREQGKEQEM